MSSNDKTKKMPEEEVLLKNETETNSLVDEVVTEIVDEASENESKSKGFGSGLGAGGLFDTTHNRGVYAEDELDSDRRDFLLDYAAEKITKIGMSVPAVLALEMSRPVSFIGSQLVWGAGPLAAVFVNDQYVRELALIMEDRNNIEGLIQRIEAIESIKVAEEKLAKQEAKRLKAEKKAADEANGVKKKHRWWPF